MNPSRSGYLIIGGLVSIAGLAVIAALLNGRTREPLPIIADVPSFELVDTSGEPFSDEDLKGSPYVVDLIFTHCAAICPRMTAAMNRLENETRSVEDLQFVSISVDPERDTPEVLASYAARVGANQERWHFLTGEKPEIWRLASEGFLLPLVEGNRELGDDEIIHSQYFVLVDGDAKIRGVYDMRDAEAMLRLRGDVRMLTP
jgi:cytochrome oxidase Cu insertion factor (SCO1/SenC/PrrC family)